MRHCAFAKDSEGARVPIKSVPPIFRSLNYNMQNCVTYNIYLVHTRFSLKVYSNFYIFSSRPATFVADLIAASATLGYENS
jgi:hypothetical protein